MCIRDRVQGEGGAGVLSERAGSFAGPGAEDDDVVCLGQGGNQVRGGFVAVLVAGQDEVARLRVRLGNAGTLASGTEISLEDILNTANLLGIGQGAVGLSQRRMDAAQSLVGVLTRVVSGGKSVAGQQACLVGCEGAARLAQGG